MRYLKKFLQFRNFNVVNNGSVLLALCDYYARTTSQSPFDVIVTLLLRHMSARRPGRSPVSQDDPREHFVIFIFRFRQTRFTSTIVDLKQKVLDVVELQRTLGVCSCHIPCNKKCCNLMITQCDENSFSVLLAVCEGNPPHKGSVMWKTFPCHHVTISSVFSALWEQYLTHWGRVTHICVNNPTIIGSDNGLSPSRRQAIIWTNAGILLIETLGTNFSEILIEILTFSFKKMRLKVSSAKRRPFCLGLNVLVKSRSYVAGVASAQLQWHLLNLNGGFFW